ncbi:hypothetical protein LZ31DRAFT_199718 [Colletotrichum somersetense]|nr:hypothetical protein LZ31DRAFT_199718 [Colletotrichum somersetense]
MLSRQVALAGKRKQRRGFQGTVHANIGPGWQTGLKGLGRGAVYQTITSGVFPWVSNSPSSVVWQRRVWIWAYMLELGFRGVHMPRGTFCDVSAFLVSSPGLYAVTKRVTTIVPSASFWMSTMLNDELLRPFPSHPFARDPRVRMMFRKTHARAQTRICGILDILRSRFVILA